MSLTLTRATPLTTANTSASLAITAPDIQAGTIDSATGGDPTLPVFGGPVQADVRGVYLTASAGAAFTFRLLKHRAGGQGQAIVMGGGAASCTVHAAPLATLSGVDRVTVEITSLQRGSLQLSIVQ